MTRSFDAGLAVDPALDRLTANAVYAALLVDMLTREGVSRDRLLADTGIESAQLESLDARLTARQYRGLIDNAQLVCTDPTLAVRFGLQLKLSTHGFLGFAAMSAATLGDALALAVKYFRTRFDFIALHEFNRGESKVLQVELLVDMGNAESLLMKSVMISFGTMALNLMGEIPKGVSVNRSCEQPACFGQVEWFPQQVPVAFNQPANELVFSKALLQRPLNLSDPMARALAEAQCERELETIQVQDDLIYRIRRLLQETEPNYLKLDAMAAQLHLSARTLKRRLQAQGTSFQAMLDQVRMQRARQLLQYSRLSVDAIASALGYSDASNFSRAFRRCEGVTPAQFRREHNNKYL